MIERQPDAALSSTPRPPRLTTVARLRNHLAALAAALMLGVLAVVIAPPTKAYACDCAGISTSRALRQSSAVFRGTVVDKESVGRGDDARTDIRFQVDAVYKGTVFREQVVASPRDSEACGLDPRAGSTWVIFATDGIEGSGDDAVQRLITNLCSGNVPSGNVPSILGRGRPPLDGASDREEQSISTDQALSRGLAIGGIALLSIVALAGIGLAVLWRPGRSSR
jgi:hypothetical protein